MLDLPESESDVGGEEDNPAGKPDVDFAEGDEEGRGRDNLPAEVAKADVPADDQDEGTDWKPEDRGVC